MIISTKEENSVLSFESLLSKTNELMKRKAKDDAEFFLSRAPDKFEIDLYEQFLISSKNTPFENSIELVSGKKFPDIVINKYFGVEVKTTKQNHWKSTGNSVFENTRIDKVNRIYLYFARLTNPISFRYRKYQECLYDVAVTHSPRYLINMELMEGETIFDKIGLDYDSFRNLENPSKPILDYYRKITKEGEEPWWMGSGGESDETVSPIVRLFSNLEDIEKTKIINQAMAYFPEVFSNSSTKYLRVATWLVARHGIVDPSLRDRFSAGGKVNLSFNDHYYEQIPRIYKNLVDNIKSVQEVLKNTSPEELLHYWKKYDGTKQPQEQWAILFVSHSSTVLPDNQKFLIDLLGHYYSGPKPSFLREQEAKYNLG